MNDTEPLISIITPTFNSGLFVSETIESVLKQTYENWEMIIVDDASSDNTIGIVTSYSKQDDRVKILQLKENSGAAIARNTAIDVAKGRFLAFLDSDDLWLPNKLEKQVAFMLENDLAFTFTGYKRIKENGIETGAVMHAPKSIGYHGLLKHCIIGCLTVMLDVNQTGKVKMKNLRNRQDYVLWLELTKKGFKAYGYPEVLAEYRLVSHSISSNKLKMAKLNWRVYRKVEKQNLFMTSWYFTHYIWYYIKRKFYHYNSEKAILKYRRCQRNNEELHWRNTKT